MANNCGALLREVAEVGWFQQVGRPLEAFTSQRIDSWEQWPGPGFAGVEQLSLDLQGVKDAIDRDAPRSTSTWEECLGLAVKAIAKSVPGYSASEDTWHAPTAAVWHAAWVISLRFGLVACGRSIPPIVEDQMTWFARGRWPSAYTSETVSAANKAYLVL